MTLDLPMDPNQQSLCCSTQRSPQIVLLRPRPQNSSNLHFHVRAPSYWSRSDNVTFKHHLGSYQCSANPIRIRYNDVPPWSRTWNFLPGIPTSGSCLPSIIDCQISMTLAPDSRSRRCATDQTSPLQLSSMYSEILTTGRNCAYSITGISVPKDAPKFVPLDAIDGTTMPCCHAVLLTQ
jgi:hypothetical protein